MNKIFFVVFLSLTSNPLFATSLADTINSIESKWATTFYGEKKSDASGIYQKLLLETQVLTEQFPSNAEPLLWHAIILATDAEHQPPIKALEQITLARDLLLKVIAIDPNGVEGSAQVTLASIFYMMPSWPIAFGDTTKAEDYFKSALSICPDSIDANYFYGDFLLSNNKPEQAIQYFKKALAIPARQRQRLTDQTLQHKAMHALNTISDTPKKLSLSLFNTNSTP